MILYSDTEPNCFLYAELRRDVAFSPERLRRLMQWMLLVSLGIGAVFFAIGAWPVVGFLGLDVLLVWGAFKLYARSQQRQFERIILDREALHIERHHGRRSQQIALEPAFLAVHTDEMNNSDPVHLCQRGRCASVGRWLGQGERLAVIRMLKGAMRRRQAALVAREA